MSAALSEHPFYEEWWFLLVMALVGLILILILVFALLLHGHSSKYKACGTGRCLCCFQGNGLKWQFPGALISRKARIKPF